MTDYERVYRKSENALGDPFPEVISFFDERKSPNARVLDVGCGQGRDALPIAAQGYTVVGIDLSETGVAQLVRAGQRQGLNVSGVTGDILEFEPAQDFDAVLLDRVIHMLKTAENKKRVLEKSVRCIRGAGAIVVVETPKNLPLIEAFFSARPEWKSIYSRTGFRFYSRE